MAAHYEELDHQVTPLGELVLRRRALPGRSGEPVYEITLGGAFLMSSLVNDSEVALSDLALDAWGKEGSSVLVGGLGLGYTAKAAVEDARVRSVTVVELLPEVIAWHERGLLPIGRTLIEASSCQLVADDFYAVAGAERAVASPWDVVLVDIDHSPEALLHKAHARFYTPAGLRHLERNVRDGGIFALWAGAAPDADFLQRLEAAFGEAWVEVVTFHNPSVGRDDVNTIYLARKQR